MLGVDILADEDGNSFFGGVQEGVRWCVQESVILLVMKKGFIFFDTLISDKQMMSIFFLAKNDIMDWAFLSNCPAAQILR